MFTPFTPPFPSPLYPLPARLAVLLSGRGSNFEAIAAACHEGQIPARIVAVLSDHGEAPGLDRSRVRGIPAFAVERSSFASRADHEARIEEILAETGVNLICLAGYMRVLSPAFVARHTLGILNIHPSLLPAFPGLEPQAQAIRHGVKISGATVHFVDAGVDSGPIVSQECVAVEPYDDAGSLSERILDLEHRLYVRSLAAILEGGWSVEGRAIRFPRT